MTQDSEQIRQQLDPVANGIQEIVGSQLKDNLESLASTVITQGDLAGTMGHIIKIAITEGIQQEFVPLVQRYLQRVEADVPESIHIASQFNYQADDRQSMLIPAIGGIATLASFVLRAIPIVGVVIPIITGLLTVFSSNYERDRQKEQQREAARDYVLDEVIPSVLAQVRLHLRQYMQGKIDEINAQFKQRTDEYQQSIGQAISMLERQLTDGKIAAEAKRQVYQSDFAKIELLSQQWSEL